VANGQRDDVLRAAAGAQESVPRALTEGFQSAFLVGAGVVVLALVAAAMLIRSEDSRGQVGAEVAAVPAA
jgi:hypothetical protein